jgi:hypothetical protein
MLTKYTLDSIQSGDEEEMYSKVTDAALYMATGGYLMQCNQLLTELWKYNLPHDRTTWLQPFPLNNPALLPVDEIDFIKNVMTADEFDALTDFPVDEDDPETFKDYLSRGIMISRYPDEQMVWLISPKGEKDIWQTWFFAFWLPGEHRYPGFRYYMEDQLKGIESYKCTGG